MTTYDSLWREPATAADVLALLARVRAWLPDTGRVVSSGVLPADSGGGEDHASDLQRRHLGVGSPGPVRGRRAPGADGSEPPAAREAATAHGGEADAIGAHAVRLPAPCTPDRGDAQGWVSGPGQDRSAGGRPQPESGTLSPRPDGKGGRPRNPGSGTAPTPQTAGTEAPPVATVPAPNPGCQRLSASSARRGLIPDPAPAAPPRATP